MPPYTMGILKGKTVIFPLSCRSCGYAAQAIHIRYTQISIDLGIVSIRRNGNPCGFFPSDDWHDYIYDGHNVFCRVNIENAVRDGNSRQYYHFLEHVWRHVLGGGPDDSNGVFDVCDVLVWGSMGLQQNMIAR